MLNMLIENGEQREQKNLILTMEQYCEIKPEKGNITEEMYDALEAADEVCRAIRCGENLLSYGANSVQMLARKIVQHGYSRESAFAAAKKLEERQLINEEKDVAREVEKCLRKLWGAKRISSHLWSRGYAKDALNALPQVLEEVDFSANCAALIEKHYGGLPETEEDKRRMLSGLSRYGYSLPQIKEAMKILKRQE